MGCCCSPYISRGHCLSRVEGRKEGVVDMPAVERDDGRWSALLPELLVPILQRVPTVRDRIRIGSVCSWWRLVLTEARRLLPPTAPLLLLPYSEEEDGLHPGRREVRGIPSNWVHRVLLPDSQYMLEDGRCHHRPKKVIRGSSMGWLLVTDGGRDAQLWNPITGEEIPLPRDFICRHKFCVDKVVLSSTTSSSTGHHQPPQGRCCTVMVLRKCCQELCFCRVGDDDRWTTFEDQPPEDREIRYEDVIFYQGQFYAVTYGGGVVMFDLGPKPKLAAAAAATEEDDIDYYDHKKYYLVESSGDLLRVARLAEAKMNDVTFWTIKFEVHKLDLDTKKWSKVASLGGGDQALFLGKSSSVSFAASTADGHKRNCIYFLDDDYDSCFPSGCWERDMGVFDMEDGSITTFDIDKYTCSSNKNCTSLVYCPQFWIHLAP